MDKLTITARVKQWIASIGFRLFIWGNETTEEEYWEEIYQQEKRYKQTQHLDNI